MGVSLRTSARALLLLASSTLACGGTRGDAPGLSKTPPPTHAEGHGTAPAPPSNPSDVHGELVILDGQRVLRLWGTPTQMGYAHGALLGTQILEIVDGYALDVIPPATLDAAAMLYTSVARVPPRLREEAEGIVAGMMAAGGARVPRLDRDLRAADLLVLNAMTDLVAIGCSSVSAWGTGTERDETLAGAPIMVRNLDWSDDPQLLRNQLLIVYLPEDAERQPVVSVAFAGYIGCLSCINEAGVSALFNMGYGEGAASPAEAMRGFSPANLLLRDTLERRDVDGDGHSTADDVETSWRTHDHAGSYILHLLEPRRDGVAAPARVLEIEADGVATRRPGDEVLGDEFLAATNHLRQGTAPPSCSRYAEVETTVRGTERRLDRERLWQLGTRLRLPQVVHALLVEPETRRLHVWFRAPAQDPTDSAAPVVHEWSTLVERVTD